MLELWQDHYGYREVTAKGLEERNVLFRTFEQDGLVTGFGMDSPGKIIRNILRFRRGGMPEAERAALLSPFSLGFYTTLVCECALESLARGRPRDGGVVVGETIDARQRLREAIGDAADRYYEPSGPVPSGCAG